ncbi:MAG: hypothetical protein KC431_14675, partial [Myxococcales bacterium]|nr:hypothetical protein [Myxococcales bacterium]
AGRSRRGDLNLGGYRVSAFTLHDEDFDGTGPFAGDGRTRPTQQLRMRFELSTPEGARWRSNCVAQRRQPPDHDLAAAVDELRDEIALRCELEGPLPSETRWVLTVDGDLGNNLLGRLQLEGEDSLQVVEIVMWHQLLDLTKRHMPASLALIRSDALPQSPGGGSSHTAAALILDSPERAWLARELDVDQRGLAMVALLSLRLLPLGFDS